MAMHISHLDLDGLEQRPDGSWHLYHGSMKLMALGGLALVMTAGAAWMAWSSDDPFIAVVGYAGVALFGLGTLFSVSRVLRPRPALVLTEDGFGDHASAVGVGHLGWDEIDYVVPYQFSNQWMLGIYPVDIDAVMRRQTAMRRLVIRANLGLGAAPVNIPQSALPVTAQELAAFLGKHFGVRVEAS